MRRQSTAAARGAEKFRTGALDAKPLGFFRPLRNPRTPRANERGPSVIPSHTETYRIDVAVTSPVELHPCRGEVSFFLQPFHAAFSYHCLAASYFARLLPLLVWVATWLLSLALQMSIPNFQTLGLNAKRSLSFQPQPLVLLLLTTVCHPRNAKCRLAIQLVQVFHSCFGCKKPRQTLLDETGGISGTLCTRSRHSL